MLGLFGSGDQGFPLPLIDGLDDIMDALCRFRPFLSLDFLDSLADALDRMVRRTVVDDNDFQFVRRIELVHGV